MKAAVKLELSPFSSSLSRPRRPPKVVLKHSKGLCHLFFPTYVKLIELLQRNIREERVAKLIRSSRVQAVKQPRPGRVM